MNILIVDDQISVINGLMSSINFRKLGYQRALSASSADEALGIMAQQSIDVLVSDIEMPGKDGLQLNAIVREKYPEVLRILLTSHAIFSYAQEGLKLGCFDYLVQPVPYGKIEESLAKAAVQIKMNEKARKISSLGRFFESHRTQFLNTAMLNLFSKNSEVKQESIRLLRQAGYDLNLMSCIKLLLVDVNEKQAGWKMTQDEAIMAIKMTIRTLGLSKSVGYIIGKNRYDTFVILFFSAKAFNLSITQLETLYSRLETNLDTPVSCYVGEITTLQKVRDVVNRLHSSYKNNISREPGLISVPMGKEEERVPTSLEEFINRWEALLKADQKSLLQNDIESFLDRNLSNSTNGFSNLCMLHQRLTQMFFNYFYENGIDILALFNESMTYETFMESYNTIDSLKKAIRFLISAANSSKKQEPEASYVERAKTYILENTDKLLTVKDVAGYIGLNPEYFTRLFKKETGHNIKDYILQCKFTIAKDLLTNSNLPISMVALELGYSNFSHFTQMFKRVEGLTPKEYRSLEQKEEG